MHFYKPIISHLNYAEPVEGIRDPPRVYGARASDKRIPSAVERPRHSRRRNQRTEPLIIEGGDNVQVMQPGADTQTAPLHRKGRPRGTKDTCGVCGGPHKAGTRFCEVTKPALVAAKQAHKEQAAASRRMKQAARAENSEQRGGQKRVRSNKSNKGSGSTEHAAKRCKAQSPTPSHAGDAGGSSGQQLGNSNPQHNSTSQQQSGSCTSHSTTGADTSESVLERPFTVISHCPSQYQQERSSANTACGPISAVSLSYFLQNTEHLLRGDSSLSQAHAECITLGTDVYEQLKRDDLKRDHPKVDGSGYVNCGMFTFRALLWL